MRGTRGMKLGPRAKTGVYQPKRIEPLQRIFIEAKPLGLVIRTLIPIEPQPAQIVHKQLGPRTAAGTVVQDPRCATRACHPGCEPKAMPKAKPRRSLNACVPSATGRSVQRPAAHRPPARTLRKHPANTLEVFCRSTIMQPLRPRVALEQGLKIEGNDRNTGRNRRRPHSPRGCTESSYSETPVSSPVLCGSAMSPPLAKADPPCERT